MLLPRQRTLRRAPVLATVLLVALLGLSSLAGATTFGPSSWDQLGYDAQHPSSYGPAGIGTGSTLWSTPTDGSVVGMAVANGRVFATTSAGTVEAWNATTGAFLWREFTLGMPTVAPVVEDGYVYVGTDGGLLQSFRTSNGLIGAMTPTGIRVVGLAVDPGAGILFVTTSDGIVWSYSLPDLFAMGDAPAPGSPVTAPTADPASHQVYVGSGTDVQTFDVPWLLPLGDVPTPPVGTAPVTVSPDGTFFLASPGGEIVHEDPVSGAVFWHELLPALGPTATPIVESNGHLLLTAGGALWWVDAATGSFYPAAPLGASASGVAVAGDLAYVPSGFGDIWIMDTTGPIGLQVGDIAIPPGTPSTPVVVDGVLFEAVGGQLLALDAGGVPQVAAHAGVTAEATGPSGANVTFAAPTWFDHIGGSGTASCSPGSGSTFALGATTVTCTATGAYGVQGSTTFTITVQDTTPPTIAPHGNLTASATGPSGAQVNYTAPKATDVVDGTDAVTCTPGNGTFPVGNTTVTCTSTDAHNNTATSSFHVTVGDTTPPVVASHGNITVEATGPQGTSVTYVAPHATDLVDGSVPVTCSPASGHTFPVGTTTVRCAANDTAGNVGRGTFTVTVQDTVAPVVQRHADLSLSLSSPSGAVAAFKPPKATDTVDGTVSVTCSPASGSTFPLGTSPVTCTATDASGNTGFSRFLVTVHDTSPPSVASHPDVVAYVAGSTAVPVDYGAPAATDPIYGSLEVICTPVPGNVFPLGDTTVTCVATDPAGLSASSSFTVTVVNLNVSATPASSGDTLTFTTPGGSGLSGISVNATVTNPATGDETTVAATTGPDGSVHLNLPAAFQKAGTYEVAYTATYHGTSWNGTNVVQVASSGSSNVPAPGAVFAAAGLLGAALVLRRRR